MNWQKAEIAIKKINALHKSMSMGQGTITSIERDLMLNYIRQLYELFLEQEVEEVSGMQRRQASNLDIPGKPDFEIVDQKGEAEKKWSEQKAEPKKPTPPPRIIEIPESLKELESSDEAKEEKKPEQPPQPPQPDREMPKRKTYSFSNQSFPSDGKEGQSKPTPSKRPDLEALFDFKKGSELADKLSEQPLHDLTKAISINDRLLYMNQLFGKDMKELDESLKLLNRFESLQEAKSLLYNLAEQYNWTEEENMEVARDFIKLVRRRYI